MNLMLQIEARAWLNELARAALDATVAHQQ